jgi:hypothetical protein
MPTTVVNGTTYTIPSNGGRGWGTEVTNLLKALGDNSLLIKGGSIPLTSDADFGASFGLVSIYFKSRSSNIATAGVLRLANTDSIGWRNGANSADLLLAIASNKLQFAGVDLVDVSSSQTLTTKTIDASSNTISNLTVAMLAAGVLVTSTTLTGASNTNVPSTLAVKTYIDTQDATKITGAGASTDNAVVRFDGTGGSTVQNSVVIVGDTGAVSGVTQLDVDNVRVDGNTISTTDTNGNLILAPNGTGYVGSDGHLRLRSGKDLIFQDDDNSQSITVSVPADVTSNRTPQIPDDTGNFVLTSAAQTLTNKTISGSSNTISNLLHGTQVDNPSTGVHGVTGSVVGTSDTQVITNKDVDGGTAANTRRITLPKDTTTNINSLTRKQGTLVYDTTTNEVKYDNGTTLTALGASGGSLATADGVTAGTVKTHVPEIHNAIKTVSSADYTILDNDGYATIYLSSFGGSNRTFTLPASANNIGRRIRVVVGDTANANTLAVSRAGSDVIYDGASNTATSVNILKFNETKEFECLTSGVWSVIGAAGGVIVNAQSLGGGFTAGNLHVVRVNNVIHVQVQSPAWNTGAYNIVSSALIPSGYRPTVNTLFCGASGDSSHTYNMAWLVDTSGQIVLRMNTTSETGPDTFPCVAGSYIIRN